MQTKQDKMNRWRPRCLSEMGGARGLAGITLTLFSFVFPGSPAHAIGPYTAEINTFIDQGTSLEWQKTPDATLHTWENALAYCENLSLDSKTDWRVPDIRELKSIVDYSRYYPAIDPAVPCQSSTYWSSTTAMTSSLASAWAVFFGNGDDIWVDKTKSYPVRCVRVGTSGHR